MILTNITKKNNGLNTRVVIMSVKQFTFLLSFLSVIIFPPSDTPDPVDYSCDRGCLIAIAITFGSTTGGLSILSIGQLIYILKRLKGTDVCV